MIGTKYENFKGLLKTGEYHEVLDLLRQRGITYRDIGFGFDRFFFDKGLYRITHDTVYLIYSFSPARPHACACLSYRDQHVNFRPTL